jgi:hypothetical protein
MEPEDNPFSCVTESGTLFRPKNEKNTLSFGRVVRRMNGLQKFIGSIGANGEMRYSNVVWTNRGSKSWIGRLVLSLLFKIQTKIKMKRLQSLFIILCLTISVLSGTPTKHSRVISVDLVISGGTVVTMDKGPALDRGRCGRDQGRSDRRCRKAF